MTFERLLPREIADQLRLLAHRKENEMSMKVPLRDRRYTIQDAHTRTEQQGLQNIEGTNESLMSAHLAPGERHWHNLNVGEHTRLKGGYIVVRIA